MKPRIVFLGSSSHSVIVLETLLSCADIVLAITLPDRILGRKKVLTPNPVKVSAQSHHIRVLTTEKITKELIDEVATTLPDFLVVADFGLILPQSLLAIAAYAPVNVHPSLLPKYRGPSPVQSTILAGETETGVTIIRMNADVDAGEILSQETYALSGTETSQSLLPRLFHLGATLLPSVLAAYQNRTQKEIPQSTEATFTRRFTKEDGYITLSNITSEELDRKTRAFYPWPGTWTHIMLNNKQYVLKFLPDGKLQLEGKQPMSYKDFFNGYPQLRTTLAPLLTK